MAEYDLTSRVGGYLDRHLIFPMLEFLTEKKVSATMPFMACFDHGFRFVDL